MKKTIVVLVVTIAIAAVLFFNWVGPVASWKHSVADLWHTGFTTPPVFRTLPVVRDELFIGVTATGTVEPVEIIDVGAQIIGSIKSFGPDPDQPGKTIDYRSRVKQGAVLAQMDDLPHRAELDRATVDLRLAEAELTRARARARQTGRDLDRVEKLRAAVSLAEHDRAQAENEIATAEVAIAEAKLAQAEIAKKQAEINLGYTVISSPVDGVVIDRRVNVGQTVVAGLNAPSLFLLAKNLNQMLVWAAVNEADIGDIHVGQKVTFTVDAYPDQTFSGTVSQVRLNASLQQNVVTYGVIVDVENKDGKLLPYMTAKLQFEVARHIDATLVPNQALRWRPTWDQISPEYRSQLPQPEVPAAADQSGSNQPETTGTRAETTTPTVWVLAEDGFVRPVAVEIGLSDGMMTEVVAGDLTPGDEVVGNVIERSQPDFVSSFVDPVTESDD